MAWLKVTWVRSTIGLHREQRKVVAALGLRRMHQTVVHTDSPSVRGMLMKVKHLLEVQEVSEAEAEPYKSEKQKATAGAGASKGA